MKFQSSLPRGERLDLSDTNIIKIDDFNPRSREGSDHIWTVQTKDSRNFNPRSREGSDERHPISTSDIRNFNPRSREGSDDKIQKAASDVSDFNPRSREGSDDRDDQRGYGPVAISILAPARGATIAQIRTLTMQLSFQSSLPRGERPGLAVTKTFTIAFQSSLPRGERPSPSDGVTGTWDISILAPARGATAKFDEAMATLAISILAPARGATKIRTHASNIRCDFNPRSREGSDQRRGLWPTRSLPISILAPARGATGLAVTKTFTIAFQSSLPRGERLYTSCRWGPYKRFQSSLPRGERPFLFLSIKITASDFNPRSREGSDNMEYDC